MKCLKCSSELNHEFTVFYRCFGCDITYRYNENTQELRKVSYDKEPETEKTETPKPKKSDFKILQDYDDDGWRLIEFRNGVQEWQHKLPTVEPEENPEVLTPFDESGLRKVRSRSTGEILYQHRDYLVPIRPLTLESAIAYWLKIECVAEGDYLKYLCDPFDRDLLTYKQAFHALPEAEQNRLRELPKKEKEAVTA